MKQNEAFSTEKETALKMTKKSHVMSMSVKLAVFCLFREDISV